MPDSRSLSLVGVHSSTFQMGETDLERIRTCLEPQSGQESEVLFLLINYNEYCGIVITHLLFTMPRANLTWYNIGSHPIFQMGKLSLQEMRVLVCGHTSWVQLS